MFFNLIFYNAKVTRKTDRKKKNDRRQVVNLEILFWRLFLVSDANKEERKMNEIKEIKPKFKVFEYPVIIS